MSQDSPPIPPLDADSKDKLLVVRISTDLYSLLSDRAEQTETSVSALVRLLLAFHFYPDLVEQSVQAEQRKLADMTSAEMLDGGLAQYEAGLNQLAESTQQFETRLMEELQRVRQARQEINQVLERMMQGIGGGDHDA